MYDTPPTTIFRFMWVKVLLVLSEVFLAIGGAFVWWFMHGDQYGEELEASKKTALGWLIFLFVVMVISLFAPIG